MTSALPRVLIPSASPSAVGLSCRSCNAVTFTTTWRTIHDGSRHVSLDCADCGDLRAWLPLGENGQPANAERSQLPADHPSCAAVPSHYQFIGMIRQADGVWKPVGLAGSLGAVWDVLLTYPGEGDRLCYPTAPANGKVSES
jgi:hypothetical protein